LIHIGLATKAYHLRYYNVIAQPDCCSFIHSGHFYSASSVDYYSEALPTQHGYCAGISRRSATVNSDGSCRPNGRCKSGNSPVGTGPRCFYKNPWSVPVCYNRYYCQLWVKDLPKVPTWRLER